MRACAGRVLTRLEQRLLAFIIADFALRLVIAPDRPAYLKSNWLSALSLPVPALRIGRLARIVRVVRVTRGARLIRAVGSLDRDIGALGTTMARRGVPYALALTVAFSFAGAAGMYGLEPHTTECSATTRRRSHRSSSAARPRQPTRRAGRGTMA